MSPRTRLLSIVIACALAAAVPVGAQAPAPAPARPRSGAPDPSEIAAAAQEASLRHYLQGVLLESEGDLSGAIDEIGRAFAFDPASPDLAVKLADLSLQAGNPSATAQNMLRRSDFISQGVVMTSISPTPRPWPSNAAFSERNGNFRVCFSRLNRSSSKTIVGMPSLSSARPESWVLVTMPRMFTMRPSGGLQWAADNNGRSTPIVPRLGGMLR